MARLVPLSLERHAGKAWLRFKDLAFARADAVVPVLDAEAALAASSMPLAFVQTDGRYVLVAVLSLEPGRNVFIAPNSQWVGPYVPACFRVYPFRLLTPPGSDKALLCVDEDSGLLGATGTGEAFYDAAGNPSEAICGVFRHVELLERHRQATDVATAALADAGVLLPWDLKVRVGGAEKPVAGLYRVDEAILSGLEGDRFLELRKAGALPIAYAQMISMGQIRVLEELSRLHQHNTPALKADLGGLESLDSIFGLSNDEVVRFRN